MPALAEKADSVRTPMLDWDPGEETIVPSCHGTEFTALSWDEDEDTIVPGHHQQVHSAAFTWAN